MLLLSDLDDIYHMEGLLGLVYIYHMDGLLGLVYISYGRVAWFGLYIYYIDGLLGFVYYIYHMEGPWVYAMAITFDCNVYTGIHGYGMNRALNTYYRLGLAM